MIIYQGATYNLPIRFKIGNAFISSADVQAVEFSFDGVIKMYPGVVTCKDDTFTVPLTQEDTFKLRNPAQFQARILFNDGNVKPIVPIPFEVGISESKAVLKYG